MDDDTVDLARQLLSRAGMAMEDVCDVAVASPREPGALREAADTISAALVRSSQFAAAAIALLGVRSRGVAIRVDFESAWVFCPDTCDIFVGREAA